MSDTTQVTNADITAGFAEQLQQPGKPLPDAPVDEDREIPETETEQAPDVEADEAPAGEEITEPEAEPSEDPETDHLEATIQPPIGLTAEQQAAFAQADPGLQQFMATREAQRTADYTVKTEHLAEQRKALEAHQAEVSAQRQQYAQILQGIAQAEPTPPPASLAEEDPDSYQVQRAQYEEQRDLRDKAQAEFARVQSEHQAELKRQQEAHQARVRAELPALIPDMADAKKATAIEAELKSYALSKGIPEANYSGASAHELGILWKAMQFDKGATGKAQSRKAPPKSQRPGSAKQPKGAKESARDSMRAAAKKTDETGDLTHMFKAKLLAEKSR